MVRKCFVGLFYKKTNFDRIQKRRLKHIFITEFSQFSQRLKEARKKKGLTQQQLGELTELSDKYISRIETGKADMSLDCFVALINTLEISADYVLQDSLYMDYEIGDDEKKKHISYQRFGAEKTEQLLYMLDKLTAMMK